MSLIYNGHDFGTLFVYGDPTFSILNSQPVLEDVNGRNGQAFLGMTYGSSEVSFTVGLIDSAANRRAAFSQLGQWLMVDEPKPLYLPDTPDRYYLAVPNGAIELERCIKADKATVTFLLVDPIAYGETKTATIPSGGSVTINVGGTAPTEPTITASAAVRNSTAQAWGIQMDDGDYIHVDTGSASSRSVNINCHDRICKVSNAVKLPTLDSDWLVMEPGAHTVEMDYGTGAATITWVERWY